MEEVKAGCAIPMDTDEVEESTINDEQEKTTLKEESKMIMVGKPAPNFKAQAFYQGKFVNVSLEEFKGKWVYLCFYPGDFTFVWATEVAAVAAKNKEFEELGAQVLSCSADSVFTHKIWNDNELSKMTGEDIPFPMLSDQNGQIGKMYGIYNEEAGTETRGRFIIDPDGIVQAYEVLTPPVGRNVSEGIRQLKAFQHVRATAGAEVTPSGWKPGKKVLKPGPHLVGNVWKEWSVKDAFDE